MTLTPGLTFLAGLSNYEATGRLSSPSLDRMRTVAAVLGNPERELDAVHVTGTNGKGSTSALVAGLLARSGRKVGLYTSPHLQAVNERIRVDGQQVSNQRLDAALRKVQEAARQCAEPPTWFEAMTLAGFLVLSEERVDAAVIEVGMLGRWDATNIVDARVAVVTNVELDHLNEAGGTRRAVAAEKAGIIKTGATLVLGESDPTLTHLFLDRLPAAVHLRGRDFRWVINRNTPYGWTYDFHTPFTQHRGLAVGMHGRHQADNASLALAAAEAFLGQPVDIEVARTAVAEVVVPGRWEQIELRPEVFIDGAHNSAAGRALRRTVRSVPRRGPRVLIVGVMHGRDPGLFLDSVGVDDYDVVICTEPPGDRALRATDLAVALEPTSATVLIEPDVRRAGRIAVLAAGTDGLVVGTGSLYLLDPLRQSIRHVVLAPPISEEEIAV